MKIWVDADACPVAIKEILFKAAERKQIEVILVANRLIKVPASRYIQSIRVASGFDVADNEIIKRMGLNDLVITADIPLAAEVVEKGGTALNPRGEVYTEEDIRSRLNMRDFMESLRDSGVETGGPPPLSQKDRQKFANNLDKILLQHNRRK